MFFCLLLEHAEPLLLPPATVISTNGLAAVMLDDLVGHVGNDVIFSASLKGLQDLSRQSRDADVHCHDNTSRRDKDKGHILRITTGWRISR